MKSERLEQIRARQAAATPGPWSWLWLHSAGFVAQCDLPPHDVTSQDLWPGPDTPIVAMDVSDQDGEFIAHSWEDIRDLLDEVERLRKENCDLWERAVEDAATIGRLNGKEEYQLLLRMNNEAVDRAQKAEAEVERLRHDITRHIEIATVECNRAEAAEAEVGRLREALKEERRAHRRSLNIPCDPKWDRLARNQTDTD